jgi:hypothetical protein
MARWEDYDEAFVATIRSALSPEMDIERDVYISDTTGLVILKEANGAMRPLGCPFCLMGTRGQNALGHPTINNRALIPGEEATEIPENTPVEILANLWLCPQCRMPQDRLLPAFTGLQAMRPE